MLAQMPSAVVEGWRVFLTLEPQGTEAQDLHTALLCSTVAAGNPHRRKGARVPDVTHFLKAMQRGREDADRARTPQKPQSSEQMAAVWIGVLEGLRPTHARQEGDGGH